jgi:hypothetical protein
MALRYLTNTTTKPRGDAATIRGDRGFDERSHGTRLVRFHETAVADHVGR